MSDGPYVKLRESLDRFPLGFPQTPSGVEIKILKRLFTEEEAETTLLLTPLPEEEPFDRVVDMAKAILEGKKKNA
jgi:electron transport complex protein RnfB